MRGKGPERKPQKNPMLQQWEQLLSEQERQAHAAETQRQQQQFQAEEAAKLQRLESERRIRTHLDQFDRMKAQAEVIGNQTCQQLGREGREQQLEDVARFIKDRIWRSDKGVSVSLEKVVQPDVIIRGGQIDAAEYQAVSRALTERLEKELGMWKLRDNLRQAEVVKDAGFLLFWLGLDFIGEKGRRARRKAKIKEAEAALNDQRDKFSRVMNQFKNYWQDLGSGQGVINRSKVGWKLSYPNLKEITVKWGGGVSQEDIDAHPGLFEPGDLGGYSFSSSIVETTTDLFFGIGYVTDREEIIPEARAFVSDEQLQAGVKVFFVNSTAIPYVYPQNQQAFYEHLRQQANSLSPAHLPSHLIIPESDRRNR